MEGVADQAGDQTEEAVVRASSPRARGTDYRATDTHILQFRRGAAGTVSPTFYASNLGR
jgi:hypothetical protein